MLLLSTHFSIHESHSLEFSLVFWRFGRCLLCSQCNHHSTFFLSLAAVFNSFSFAHSSQTITLFVSFDFISFFAVWLFLTPSDKTSTLLTNTQGFQSRHGKDSVPGSPHSPVNPSSTLALESLAYTPVRKLLFFIHHPTSRVF